jgi:hypothetical protein
MLRAAWTTGAQVSSQGENIGLTQKSHVSIRPFDEFVEGRRSESMALCAGFSQWPVGPAVSQEGKGKERKGKERKGDGIGPDKGRENVSLGSLLAA